MYLLDCRMPMHCSSLPDSPEFSLFTRAVAFLQELLKEHVIKSHDEFGVTLWGTQENANSLGSTAGIVEWLPLSRPTCSRIVQLGKLAKAGMFCGAVAQPLSRSLSSSDHSGVHVHPHYSAASAVLPGDASPCLCGTPCCILCDARSFGTCDAFTPAAADCDVEASSSAARNANLNDALWCARKGFDKSNVRDGSKKIVVITCDDCPCPDMTENDESRLVAWRSFGCSIMCCCNCCMQVEAPCARHRRRQHQRHVHAHIHCLQV